jgi:hypothetical protein
MAPLVDSGGIDRLTAVLDVYGGTPERWPAGERAALLALIAASAPAAQVWAEAQAFDRLLDMAPGSTATRPAELTARLVRAARATPSNGVPDRALLRSTPERWLIGGLLAASVLMGLWLGSLDPVAGWIDPMLMADSGSDGTGQTDNELGLNDVGELL